MLIQGLLDVDSILWYLIGHNLYMFKINEVTFDDFRTLLALEAEAFLNDINMAANHALGGEHGISWTHLHFNWRNLRVFKCWISVPIGIQSVI